LTDFITADDPRPANFRKKVILSVSLSLDFSSELIFFLQIPTTIVDGTNTAFVVDPATGVVTGVAHSQLRGGANYTTAVSSPQKQTAASITRAVNSHATPVKPAQQLFPQQQQQQQQQVQYSLPQQSSYQSFQSYQVLSSFSLSSFRNIVQLILFFLVLSATDDQSGNSDFLFFPLIFTLSLTCYF
jgi:hypothetical protein